MENYSSVLPKTKQIANFQIPSQTPYFLSPVQRTQCARRPARSCPHSTAQGMKAQDGKQLQPPGNSSAAADLGLGGRTVCLQRAPPLVHSPFVLRPGATWHIHAHDHAKHRWEPQRGGGQGGAVGALLPCTGHPTKHASDLGESSTFPYKMYPM